MLFPQKTLLTLAAAQAVTAHFALTQPEWRADTLSDVADPKFSQWLYPCAGVPFDSGNITEWNGKTVTLELHHHYSYVWLNVGLGRNTSDFNVTLSPQFFNVTGAGTVCIDNLPWPKDVANGTVGTLQVITTTSGSSLYNCADFRYNPDAPSPTNCTRPNGVDVVKIRSQSGNSSQSGSQGGSGNTTDGSGGSKGQPGAASSISLNAATLSGLVVAGLTAAMIGL